MSVVHTRVGAGAWFAGGTGASEIKHIDSETTKPLIKRLDDAKLAGHRGQPRDAHEYHFRSNEMAANMALNLFAEWLRERGMVGLARQIVEGEQ